MIKFSKIHNPDESPYYRIDEFNDKNNGHALSRYVGEVWDDRVNFEDNKWWTTEELKLVIKYIEMASCSAPEKSNQYLTYGESVVQ